MTHTGESRGRLIHNRINVQLQVLVNNMSMLCSAELANVDNRLTERQFVRVPVPV